ncbi:MAG TPA: OmpH family outer membrane protein [Vicinamibacterales bacterium]|nr:OmpH family outer membrane protein [Vicinamibacterales bacterium]
MKVVVLAASLVLTAAPVFAQAAAQPKPAQPAQAKPAQPTPAPTQQPAAPAPTPAAQPPAPFPAGAKIAFFNPAIVFQNSKEGQASLGRVKTLTDKKQTENNDKQKKLAADQQKLQTGGSMLNDAARTQLEKDIEKQQVDIQRFQQDAQAEIQELQKNVQDEFLRKLQPIVDKIAAEKGLHLLFNSAEAGLAWAAPGLDLTPEVIKAMDGGAPAAAPKQ